MGLFIRSAEIKDAESIAELSGQLGYKSNTDDTQTRLSAAIKLNDNCVFVATDNETVIGWIHGFYAIRIETDPFVEIVALVVDSGYRMRGVGKMLISCVDKWAHTKTCNKLIVRSNAIRKEAHLFYENMGFRLNKEQKIFDKQLS